MKKMNNFSKKTVIIICSLMIFLSFFAFDSVLTTSDTDGDPSACHDTGLYSIKIEEGTQLTLGKGETIEITIIATGPNVAVQFTSGARDNSEFSFSPSQIIEDGGAGDNNPAADSIQVTITITAPDEEGDYKLLVIGRDQYIPGNAPDLAFLEIDVTVGEGSNFLQKIVNFFTGKFFEHMNIYLGGLAIFCLALGTLLYEINDQKYVKAHGILATTSFVLTTINIYFILSPTADVLSSYTNDPNVIDWGHLIHIISGIVGYIAGIIAIFTGLSGIRTKKPGYVALILWSFNFFYGISEAGWGVGL